MAKVNKSVLLSAACLAGWATAASAGPVTITNSTEVEAYKGSSPTGFFGGNDWGTSIGVPVFNTPSVTIAFTSSNTVDIKFTTGMYMASSVVGGTTVYAADIFLKSGGGNALPVPGSSFFNYGISLGFDSADGGHATAGLYSIPVNSTNTGAGGTPKTYLDSQDIWAGRTSYTYGGAYDAASACGVSGQTCTGAQTSPTVLTGGTLVNDAGSGSNTDVKVVVTPSGSGDLGTMDVQLTGTDAAGIATLDALFSNFDIFWGTGDCSNAPIWGNVASLQSVPEPSSLALLATAAFGFRMMRRRKRKVPAVG